MRHAASHDTTRVSQRGIEVLGEKAVRSGVIFLHALHRGSYLVSRPAARIGTGRDHPSPHQTFLKKLHEHIEHRAGQWLGNGMLVSPPAGLIDPGAIGGERNASDVVHSGKIVGQSYLLGIGDLADRFTRFKT